MVTQNMFQFNYSKITSVHIILVSSLLNLYQHLATRHFRQVFVQSYWLQKSKWMILHYVFLTKVHMTNSIRKICPIIAGNLSFSLSPSTRIYYGQQKNCQYSNALIFLSPSTGIYYGQQKKCQYSNV